MYSIDKDKVFWRKVEGETVVLNIDTGFYYTLDEVGSVIWDMILSSQDLDRIATKIANEYDIDDITAKRDMQAFLKNLKKEDLIEIK